MKSAKVQNVYESQTCRLDSNRLSFDNEPSVQGKQEE